MDKNELLEKLKRARAAKEAANKEKAERSKDFIEKMRARVAEIRKANQ